MAEETLASVTNNKQMADELNRLVRLNIDAIEAYTVAIEHLKSASFRHVMEEFKADHLRHVEELKDLILWQGGAPVNTGDYKQLLTKGKVFLGNLQGDKGILRAMKSNENQTNEGYEHGIKHLRASQDLADVLREHLADERRHREWIERELDSFVD